ncbi:MAG: hypothetical protein WBV85_05030 [Solirubrobacteraceae bacterium]
MMILLIAIPIWTFLIVLTLTVCAMARQGDSNRRAVGVAQADRSPRLPLSQAPTEQGQPSAEDARRVAA